MDKYKIVLEVLSELQKECSKGLMSKNFHIRRISKQDLASIYNIEDLIIGKIKYKLKHKYID